MSVPPLLGENWTPGFSTTTIMGCNLCTLQKREEHYKLLYEIAQVSGGTADSGISCVCVLLCMIHYACCAESTFRLLLMLLLLLAFKNRFQTKTEGGCVSGRRLERCE